MDDLIDVIEGNRRYIKCLYVYNKVCVCVTECVVVGVWWCGGLEVLVCMRLSCCVH